MTKKYFLSGSWDIIPTELFVEFISSKTDERISYSYQAMHPLLQLLRRGATFAELTKSQTYPRLQLQKIVNNLVAKGALTYQALPTSKPPQNYLDQLRGVCLGIGSIITSSKIYKTSFPGITIAQSLGFKAQFIRHRTSLLSGWGADADPLLAEIKAVIEGVERHAQGDCNVTTSAFYHDAPTLTPLQLGTTKERLEAAGTIQWTKLQEIGGHKRIMIPIDFFYHPIDYQNLGRLPVTTLNISGAAAHQSIEAATVNAALELCEHEALMVTWFGKRKTARINVESVSERSQNYIKELKKRDYTIILKDISLDLAPTVMVIALGPTGKRALTIGSCAAFSLKYAVDKALTEVVRTIIVDEMNNITFPAINRHDVHDIIGHSMYYARHENLPEVAHLWEYSETMDATDTLPHGPYKTLTAAKVAYEQTGNINKAEMHHIIEEVMKPAGIEIFSREITPQEIKRTDLKLFAVKAVAPEMVRLCVGYNQIPAHTKRFKMLFQKFGNGTMDSTTHLHPFA